VARTVLYQAPCSVLIVRQSVGAPPVEKPPTAAIAV